MVAGRTRQTRGFRNRSKAPPCGNWHLLHIGQIGRCLFCKKIDLVVIEPKHIDRALAISPGRREAVSRSESERIETIYFLQRIVYGFAVDFIRPDGRHSDPHCFAGHQRLVKSDRIAELRNWRLVLLVVLDIAGSMLFQFAKSQSTLETYTFLASSFAEANNASELVA